MVTKTPRKDSNVQKWCSRAECTGQVPGNLRYNLPHLLSKLHLIHAKALAPCDITLTWTENIWDQVNEPLQECRSSKPESSGKSCALPVEFVPVTHRSCWLRRKDLSTSRTARKSFLNSTFSISGHVCSSLEYNLEPYKA